MCIGLADHCADWIGLSFIITIIIIIIIITIIIIIITIIIITIITDIDEQEVMIKENA